MKKLLLCIALLPVLSASAHVSWFGNHASVDKVYSQRGYNFVQCTGTNVYLRKGPGKNYAYYKLPSGRPFFANDPDEFEYLGVTKNGFHKIRVWLYDNSSFVAWISAKYSYRY